MDTTKELFAKVSINTIETKMKLSLEEIERNNPNRTDLINSLRESLEDVYTVKHYMKELMENYNIEKKLSYRLADLNADLRLRIAKREEELVDLQREL